MLNRKPFTTNWHSGNNCVNEIHRPGMPENGRRNPTMDIVCTVCRYPSSHRPRNLSSAFAFDHGEHNLPMDS